MAVAGFSSFVCFHTLYTWGLSVKEVHTPHEGEGWVRQNADEEGDGFHRMRTSATRI